MFDQVLLRPALMNSLKRLEIIDRIGATSLVSASSGVPLRETISDHLPVAFVIDLN
jgi:hypothetical protein